MQGIADDMEGKLSVVKIDTDKYPSIASRYGIKVRNILLRIRFGPASTETCILGLLLGQICRGVAELLQMQVYSILIFRHIVGFGPQNIGMADLYNTLVCLIASRLVTLRNSHA